MAVFEELKEKKEEESSVFAFCIKSFEQANNATGRINEK